MKYFVLGYRGGSFIYLTDFFAFIIDIQIFGSSHAFPYLGSMLLVTELWKLKTNQLAYNVLSNFY